MDFKNEIDTNAPKWYIVSIAIWLVLSIHIIPAISRNSIQWDYTYFLNCALCTYYQDAGRTDRSARPVFQCAPYSIIDGKKWPRAINDFSSTFLCGKKGNEIFCRIVSEFQTVCYILSHTPGLILYVSMGAGKVVVVVVVEGVCRGGGGIASS